jgi:hypothetical protein
MQEPCPRSFYIQFVFGFKGICVLALFITLAPEQLFQLAKYASPEFNSKANIAIERWLI